MTLATSRNMTIVGVLALLGGLSSALIPMFDGDPSTIVNWSVVASLVINGILGILGKGAKSTGGIVDGNGKPVGI